MNVCQPLNLAHELIQCEHIQTSRQLPPEQAMLYEPIYQLTETQLLLHSAVTPSRVSVLNAANQQSIDSSVNSQSTRQLAPDSPVHMDTAECRVQSPRVTRQPLSASEVFSYQLVPEIISAGELESEQMANVTTFSREELERVSEPPNRPLKLNRPYHVEVRLILLFIPQRVF